MSNEPNKPEANSSQNSEPWDDKDINMNDIVLSNSWAVQAILNYLEEVDPNARERIWHHYEVMKEQQAVAEAEKRKKSPPADEPDVIPENN